MLIKIVPETDAEKAKMKEVEHSGINEFFLFGNKKDDDGELVDFHDWTGAYRYLIGSLYYFLSLVESEEVAKNTNTRKSTMQPPKMIKYGDAQRPVLSGIEQAEEVVQELDLANQMPSDQQPTLRIHDPVVEAVEDEDDKK